MDQCIAVLLTSPTKIRHGLNHGYSGPIKPGSQYDNRVLFCNVPFANVAIVYYERSLYYDML